MNEENQTTGDFGNVMALISKMEDKINSIKQLIEDFKVCKSDISKKLIDASINKLAKTLEEQTVSR